MKTGFYAALLLIGILNGPAELKRRMAMTESYTAKDNAGCVLQVWFSRISPNALEVSYIFTNGSIRSVYLFNKLYTMYSEQGVYLTEPQLVNVMEENGKIVISKKVAAIPPRMKVEQPNIPCVTKVPAGAICQEILRLPLPLRIWTPYTDDALPLEAVPVDRPLHFALGYFLSTPEGDRLVKTVQTSQGPAFYFYPFSVESQKVLAAGPASFAVPVLLPK